MTVIPADKFGLNRSCVPVQIVCTSTCTVYNYLSFLEVWNSFTYRVNLGLNFQWIFSVHWNSLCDRVLNALARLPWYVGESQWASWYVSSTDSSWYVWRSIGIILFENIVIGIVFFRQRKNTFDTPSILRYTLWYAISLIGWAKSHWLEGSVVLLIEANNGAEFPRCWCFTKQARPTRSGCVCVWRRDRMGIVEACEGAFYFVNANNTYLLGQWYYSGSSSIGSSLVLLTLLFLSSTSSVN